MRSRFRSSLCKVALVGLASAALGGCETGGLLVVEQKDPPAQGPSVNEIVSGGTYASNGKYRLFYTNGQPSPHQGVSTNGPSRMNGGVVGAAHSD